MLVQIGPDKMLQCGQRQHGGCGAAALARQIGQFAEVAGPAAVGGVAVRVQAEAKRPRNEPCRQSACRHVAHRVYGRFERAIFPVMGLEPHVVPAKFQPLFRVPGSCIRRVEHARRIRHEEAVQNVLFLVGTFEQVAGSESLRLLVGDLRPDGKVFLSAHSAEAQGVQRPLAVARFELLSVQREIPLVRRLKGGPDVPGSADELM